MASSRRRWGCPWPRCRRSTWWRTWRGSRRPAPGSGFGRGRRCGGSCGRSGVDLGAERQHPGGSSSWTGGAVKRTAGGLLHQGGQHRGGHRAGRRSEALGRAGRRGGPGRGSAQPAQLVLGDLGVLQARHLSQPSGWCRGGGRAAAQGDGEAAPQLRGPPLPHHLGGVVVAVAQSGCPTVGSSSPCTAMQDVGRPCGSGARCRAVGGSGHRSGGCRARAGRAVRVAKTSGLSATVSGTVLPPAIPARISWKVSAAYRREQDSHLSARRLPHRGERHAQASSAEP